MKLLSCHVEHFGGLVGFDATFTEGINGICRPNGFGKTTLASFLCAMLYGFPARAKGSRKRYEPWQGGAYGGWLIFETDGRQYRVERTFGKTPKGDRFALYDWPSGQQSTRFSENLGLELFGVDGESFARSALWLQGQMPGGFATASIQARLGQLMDATDDMGGYEQAQERLRSARSRLVPYRGTGGAAAQAQTAVAQLEMELAQRQQAGERAEQLTAQIAALESEQVAAVPTQAELHAILARYPAGVPQLEQVQAAQVELRELETLRMQLAAERQAVVQQNALPEPETLAQAARWAAEYAKPQPLRHLLLVALFVILGGLALLPVLLPAGLAVLIVGVAGLGWSLWRRRRVKMQQAARWQQLSQVLLACGVEPVAAEIVQQVARLQGACAARDAAQQRCTALEAACESRATALRTRLQDWRMPPAATLQAQLAQAAQDAQLLAAMCDPKIQQATSRNRQLEALRLERRACQAQLEEIPALEEERQRQLELRRKALADAATLDAAMELLRRARESLSFTYMDTLRARLVHYAGLLGLAQIHLDTELTLQVERDGALRQLDSCSAGDTDLLLLCMRLALLDALFPTERPPLVLDDPFVNLDDAHLKQAMALLEHYSETVQVLYLTCHSSRI